MQFPSVGKMIRIVAGTVTHRAPAARKKARVSAPEWSEG